MTIGTAEITDHSFEDDHLPVAEVFGPTFQGEGPYTGRTCSFVRLGRCNLACVFCDTPYTWDRTRYDIDAECPEHDITSVCEQIAAHGTSLTVVTGGEPLIHQRRPAFYHLITRLAQLGAVHVETNGTIAPTRQTKRSVTHFSVSPKLSNNSTDPRNKRIQPTVLSQFTELATVGRAAYKFVAATLDDLDEVEQLVTAHELPRSAVWIMPEGRTREAVLTTQTEEFATSVASRGFHLSTRLHVLIWNDRRGV